MRFAAAGFHVVLMGRRKEVPPPSPSPNLTLILILTLTLTLLSNKRSRFGYSIPTSPLTTLHPHLFPGIQVVNAVAAEVVSQGGNAHPVICDVTDDSSVKAAFREIVSIGDIEVLAP